MNLPPSLRPPKWPFFLGDAILVALAGLIGLLAPAPLSATALTLIFGCVALGAVLAVIPALLDFAAGQREAEASLQLKLEAQNARLLQFSDTLVGISGQLKSAQEATARALHTAETLPYRLQEKIGEFTAELKDRDDEEKAAIAKELESLRDAEGQHLAEIAEKILAATKEFSAAEKQALPALASAAKLSREIEPALTAATARSEQALAKAAALLEHALAQASTQFHAATTRSEQAQEQAAALLQTTSTRSEQTLTHAAAEIQSAMTAVEDRVRQTIAAAENIDSRLSDREAALHQLGREIDSALQNKIDQLHAAVRTVTIPPPQVEPRAQVEAAPEAPEPPESAATEAPAAPLPVMQLSAFPRRKREPLAPPPTEPAAASPAAAAPEEPDTVAGGETVAATETHTKREPRRKPTTRNFSDAVLPGFAEPEIVYDEAPSTTSAPAKSSDGSTRMLVTAYIGIGNKVFIRGDGPGLSREKGVPMEFVSIGKWSWATSHAIDPVTIQLFKNDDLAALGDPISLPAGHHVEVTPVFREPDPF